LSSLSKADKVTRIVAVTQALAKEVNSADLISVQLALAQLKKDSDTRRAYITLKTLF